MQPPAQDSETQSVKPCPQCGTGVKFRIDPTSQRKSCPHCGYVLPGQIGHFKLNQIIGTGGMGAVYRGLDTSLERQVAVKVMREEFARNPQFVESFLREARAAASLNHPNVAQIYSFGEQNSRYYLVMELLPNGSLDDRIEKEHRLPELDVLDVGIQVASGLRAAYERGLIHRDIKPGNILFAQDNSSKVVDFGLARFESKTASSQQEEGIWGTPYYIAPEKVSDNKEDFRSDIYSLGGTLFHALAGRAPFEAGTSTEVVLKHLSAPAVSLRAFAPDTTPQSAEVIGRMLKRDPAERPQSYDELLNDLAYAKRFALEKKPPERIEQESEYSMGMLVGTLVMIVTCLAVAIWLWFHRDAYFGKPSKPQPVVVIASTNTISKPIVVNPVTPVDPPKPPPPALDYDDEIEQAHGKAAQGSPDTAADLFDGILGKLPPNDERIPWVKLHSARAKWMASKETEAITDLNALAGSTTAESLGPAISTNQYPQVLELILLGKISGGTLDKTITGLPDWMQAIAKFDGGLAALRQNQIPEAARLWQSYAQMDQAKVKVETWAVVYQPMAGDFAREYEDFKVVEKQIATLQEAGKFSEITKLLTDNSPKWHTSTIQSLITKLSDANRDAAAKQSDKDKAAQAEKDKAQLENENKALDAMRDKKKQVLASYRFDQLLDGWKAHETDIKTEDNYKILQYHIAVSQCLADFKETLIKDITAQPYDQQKIVTRKNRLMSGKLYRVKDEQLYFKVEVEGQSVDAACTWADLPPSAVYALGEFYLTKLMNARETNNSEIARRALALAVLTREYSLKPELLSKNLSAVEQTGANVKDLRDKLFPATPIK